MEVKPKKELEIQRVTDAITQAVFEQRLPPGTRLIEAQLVESLKANRNHVRSALQRLSLRRIVSIEANKGASIAKPSVQEAREIFAARTIVERGIVEQFIKKQRGLDAALLKKQLTVEQQAIQSGIREDIIRESGEFHLLIAKLGGNSVLLSVLKDLVTQSSLILSLYQAKSNNQVSQCGCDEHNGILAAILEQDVEKAVGAMNCHLHDIEITLNLDFWESKKVDLDSVFTKSERTI